MTAHLETIEAHNLITSYQALLFSGITLPGRSYEETAAELHFHAANTNLFTESAIESNLNSLKKLDNLLLNSNLDCHIDGAVQVLYHGKELEKKVHAGAGFRIQSKGISLVEASFSLPSYYAERETNSHIAEYEGLVACMKCLVESFPEPFVYTVQIQSDSENLVNQINGESRVRDSIRRHLKDKALLYAKHFKSFSITYCPRLENEEADFLAKQGILKKSRFTMWEEE